MRRLCAGLVRLSARLIDENFDGMWLTLLFLAAWPSLTLAGQSPPIPLTKTEPAFQALIALLQRASQSRDAPAVYAHLSSNYYLDRDFGGVFDPNASPVHNFSATFQFDNSRLRPEFKDYGWNKFRNALASTQFELKPDGQLCAPHEALDRKPFPHSQLCFRRSSKGQWQIAGHINAGD